MSQRPSWKKREEAFCDSLAHGWTTRAPVGIRFVAGIVAERGFERRVAPCVTLHTAAAC